MTSIIFAAPVYSWAGAQRNWTASVAALRLLNLFFLVAAVPVIVWTIHKLWPSGTFCTLVCVAAALSPMMLLNSVRAANDSLSVLAIAIAVLCLAFAGSGGVLWAVAAAVAIKKQPK
jgi:uncharacterized membrane protein